MVLKVLTTSFFVCPIFVDARSRYLPSSLINVAIRDLLFGMENKTNNENEALFMQVQEFIVKLGRFARNKVSKCAKIRNRYNQVPHLTQDTNGKVTNSQ